MRYLFSRREPKGKRILFVESGSRSIAEGMTSHFASWPGGVEVDLVTCYADLPAGFAPTTKVFRVSDYATKELRGRLVDELRARNYAFVGMICSAEPVMTKWKWMLAFRLPAKVFIVNENGDYFWLNRENFSVLREFALVRAGLDGDDAIHTVARLAIFPFSILFLLMYAFIAHAGRLWRRTSQTQT